MEVITFIELLVILTVIFYFIYNYFCGQFNVFRKQGIPGPRPYPVFGTWWKSWDKNPHEIAVNNYNQYGKIYCTFRGRRPSLHIHEMSLLRSILIKDALEHFGQRDRRPVSGDNDEVNKTLSMLQDEQWKYLRNLMMVSFSPQLVKQRIDFANNSIREFVEYWKNDRIAKFGKMDLRVETEILCEEVMVNYTAGINLGTIGNPNHPFVINARKTMEASERSFLWTLGYLYPKLFQWLCPVFESGNEYLVKYSKKILKERSNAMNKHGSHCSSEEPDMIDKLLDCLNGNDSKGHQYIDEMVAIAQTTSTILTGYDLGTVLTRILHCLAMNQNIQEKCRLEIKEKVAKYGEISFELLTELFYVDQCIREALRLYPTIFANMRVCTKDKQYNRIFIPKGTLIEYPIFIIQRDPAVFNDPLKYDPDRFSLDNTQKRDPLLYLPFGQGPRGCFAQKFSMLVLKQCLVHILSSFKFFPISETKDPIQFTTGPSAMLTARDMWVGFKKI